MANYFDSFECPPVKGQNGASVPTVAAVRLAG